MLDMMFRLIIFQMGVYLYKNSPVQPLKISHLQLSQRKLARAEFVALVFTPEAQWIDSPEHQKPCQSVL